MISADALRYGDSRWVEQSRMEDSLRRIEEVIKSLQPGESVAIRRNYPTEVGLFHVIFNDAPRVR